MPDAYRDVGSRLRRELEVQWPTNSPGANLNILRSGMARRVDDVYGNTSVAGAGRAGATRDGRNSGADGNAQYCGLLNDKNSGEVPDAYRDVGSRLRRELEVQWPTKTPGAFLLGTSLYLAFQAIMLHIMFKTCSIQFCERALYGQSMNNRISRTKSVVRRCVALQVVER